MCPGSSSRTDAESATFLENRSDERDQPFILGATNSGLPSYKAGYPAMLWKLHRAGAEDVRGHLLFGLRAGEYRAAPDWLEQVSLLDWVLASARALRAYASTAVIDATLDKLVTRYAKTCQAQAGLKTYGQAKLCARGSAITSPGDRFIAVK